MDAPWRGLCLLSTEVALLVGIAWGASWLFHRADLRRLVWIACVLTIALVTLGVFTAFPLWLWGLMTLPGTSSSELSRGALSRGDPRHFPLVESHEWITGDWGTSADLAVEDRDAGASFTDPGQHRLCPPHLAQDRSIPPLSAPARSVLISWTLGTILLLVRFVFIRIATWWVRFGSRDLSHTPLFLWIQNQAKTFGYHRTIRLVMSGRFFTPVAFGVFQPTIGLPQGFDTSASQASERAVILHELKHLINNDPFWRAVADCVIATLWWHPAVWLLRDQLWKTSEEAADEFSVVIPNGPRELASTLLRYGWEMAGFRTAAVAMSGQRRSRSHLNLRVRRLLRLQKEQVTQTLAIPGRSTRLQRYVVVVTAVAVFFASLGAGAPEVPLFKGGSGMSWSKWCWRHSLLAAAVAAFAAPWSAPAWAEEGRKADQPAAVQEQKEREEPEEAKVERERGEKEHAAVREREREGRPEAERREEAVRDREGRPEARERQRGEPRPPEARRDQVPPAAPVLERLERQLAELREQIARAREAGQHEKVRALEGQIERLERARENIRAGRPPEGRPVPPEEARGAMLERIERRMQELGERIREAERAGREGALRELRAEMERLEQTLRQIREGRMPGPPGQPPVGPVPLERMERARRAAELLRREGFGDMAELLMRAAMGPVPPRPGMAPPAPERPPLPPERPREDRPREDRPREERPRDVPRDRPEAERR